MTVGVVWLLKIPGPHAGRRAGPALDRLPPAASQPEDGRIAQHLSATTFWGAMKTIVVADALMGIDNVLGSPAPPMARSTS